MAGYRSRWHERRWLKAAPERRRKKSPARVIGNEGRLGGAIYNSEGDVSVATSSISFNHATIRGGGYANANVDGGAVVILSSSSYSGNTADVDCDKYYDIHRTPACVN